VANTVSPLTLTPVVNDPGATYTIATSAGPCAANACPLSVGSNTITVTVTAEDGVSTRSYVVVVRRRLPEDAALVALNTSAGPVAPSFVSTTLAYTVAVANDVSTIVLTPTLSDPAATYAIQPISGTNSLVVGPNRITVTVTSQEGTQQNYVVVVTRAPSSNASLGGLDVGTVLTPTFVSGTHAYTAAVPNLPGTVVLTPTLDEPNATYSITTASGPCAANTCPLNVGPNLVTVTVIAQDGVTRIDYVVVVTRDPSDDATLGGIELGSGQVSPAFVSSTHEYTAQVPYSASPLVITPTLGHPGASYTITTAAGPCVAFACNLVEGVNAVTVTVTAEDGVTTQEYLIEITRVGLSHDATLTNLALAGATLTPAFVSGTHEYTTAVPFATGSLVITPQLGYPAAAVYTITGPHGDCTSS
jgi:hypothetical protein